MKTNKSFTKRLKVSKTGKVLSRKRGGNHFNAKESRVDQLKRHTLQEFKMTQRQKRRFLPNKRVT